MVCLRLHSRLTFVATASMPALLRWRPCHRAGVIRRRPCRRRWLSPTFQLYRLSPSADRSRTSSRFVRWNVNSVFRRVVESLASVALNARRCDGRPRTDSAAVVTALGGNVFRGGVYFSMTCSDELEPNSVTEQHLRRDDIPATYREAAETLRHLQLLVRGCNTQ